MAKRMTDSEEVERVSERLYTGYRRKINSKDSFNSALSDMLMVSGKNLTSKQKQFRDDVFSHFSENHPNIILTHSEIKAFKQAGGVSISRDRERTSKVIAKDRKEYTKEIEFPFPSKSKGRIVYSRRSTFKRKGKLVSVFRDRKGKFSSVKAKSLKRRKQPIVKGDGSGAKLKNATRTRTIRGRNARR